MLTDQAGPDTLVEKRHHSHRPVELSGQGANDVTHMYLTRRLDAAAPDLDVTSAASRDGERPRLV